MSEWISVEDRLPQLDFEVIVCSDDDVCTAIYREGDIEGNYWFDGIDSVTYWQPKPDPPKVEQE